MGTSNYLKPNRLSEVISALQTMGLHDQYRQKAEDWGYLISGNKSDRTWKKVFDEHPEFFRVSQTFVDEYTLVLRRASGNLFDKRTRKAITRQERERMTSDDIAKHLSRAPVTEAQLEFLVETAITLHRNAVEQHNAWRWWFAPTLSLIGALSGSSLGVVLGALLKTK